MNFFLKTPNHWILCHIVSVAFGIAVFRLHGDDRVRRGKARKGLYGWLVTEAQ